MTVKICFCGSETNNGLSDHPHLGCGDYGARCLHALLLAKRQTHRKTYRSCLYLLVRASFSQECLESTWTSSGQQFFQQFSFHPLRLFCSSGITCKHTGSCNKVSISSRFQYSRGPRIAVLGR